MNRSLLNYGRTLTLVACGAVIVSGAHADDRAPVNATIEFKQTVLPLFQRVCVECHGAKKQEGGLRLDRREDAFRGGDSGPAIVAGDARHSDLLRRISLPKGHDAIMPARGEPLSKSEIGAVRRWIDQGATWPAELDNLKHWAYVKPVRAPLPKPREAHWARNFIDVFVLSRLESEGLRPSPEVDKPTLIRRLSLDLIGLPPSPAEVDAFVQDADPRAYEKVVDRLLASPQFGVRWARPWLDYARYADSHGFQRDDFRDLWPYRDWVVEALNADMPYDRFTIEQLAGDLLPNATEAQRIATGFNRSAPTNVEAGSDPEETRVNQVFDRVNTLGMVWLGATLECCQCHDHKYDPFTMQDYYRLFAVFNNTQIEADRSNPKVPGSIRFLGPELPLRDAVNESAVEKLKSQLQPIQAALALRQKQLHSRDPQWEASLADSVEKAAKEHPLEVADFDSQGGATHTILDDKSVLISGEAPDRDTYTVTTYTRLTGIRAFKLETLTDPSLPGNGPGRGDAQRPNFVLQKFQLEISPWSEGGKGKGPASPSAVKFQKATADFSQAKWDVATLIDDDPAGGWAINPQFHKPHWAVFETAEPIGFLGGSKLTFTLVQNFGASRTIGRLRLSAITGQPNQPTLPAPVAAALKIPAAERTKEQTAALVEYRLFQDAEYQRLLAESQRLDAELKKIKTNTTLVMQELPQPRASKVFQRGEFRSPGKPIQPGIPAVFGPTEQVGGDFNRLRLAEWLVDREHPLTARVAVNRFWAEIFGHGLVTTPEDFGIKGDRPTHPELLDWLAVEFMEQGWSIKQLLKTIVTSSAYRQDSRITPESLARDDRNLLYARAPRIRLEAELIRDNALAISGLLSLHQGGPPVRPYQPDGLWVKVGGQRYDYVVSPGEARYRRGLYVVWKRAAPYPSFVNFDANSRLACRVSRPRSNTPLQALTLLNDPAYVEAAIAFAKRVLEEQPAAALDDQLAYAFRLAVARHPRATETSSLRKLFEAQRAAAKQHSSTTKKFLADLELPKGIEPAEFAAWYAVAAAILNLDETITKG